MAEERDLKVSGTYRGLPGEAPSRELDQAILAAAHRSVGRSHAPLVVPAGRHRWYYSLGAAAVLVLAIAVTIHVERQQPDAELAEAPPPAPAPAPQEAKPASAPSAPAAQPRPDMAARQERRPVYTLEPPAQAPKVEPQSSANAPARDEQAERNVQGLDKERAAAASRAAPAPMASQYAALSPERELERIAELRRQGRQDEADKALAEFRKRYPDYVISDEMKAKVERK